MNSITSQNRLLLLLTAFLTAACLLALSDDLYLFGGLALVLLVSLALYLAINALRNDSRRARWPRVVWNGPALLLVTFAAILVAMTPVLALAGLPVGITLATWLLYRRPSRSQVRDTFEAIDGISRA